MVGRAFPRQLTGLRHPRHTPTGQSKVDDTLPHTHMPTGQPNVDDTPYPPQTRTYRSTQYR